MNLTSQQREFVSALLNGSGHIVLRARAGCGKTSTCLEGIQALVKQRPSVEIAYCAYNKAIAEETKAKLIKMGMTDWRQVSATTVHALGFGLLKFIFKPEVDDKKVIKIIDGLNTDIAQSYGSQIANLVRYAKQAGVGFFSDQPIGDVGVWHALADHFDVNGLDDTSEADAVVETAQMVYRMSLAQTDVIDFDDMVLMPLVKNIRVRFTKDFVFVDEAQDLSRARQALARKFVKAHTGRMIVVGDDRQAIYGFSGADAAALPNLTQQLGAEVLPLSVTWRCPKAVVRLAQTLVPDIEAAEGAPEGVVRHVRTAEDLKATLDGLEPTDAVLCRNTAPLIQTAYALIRAGKACKVEGRDIGKGMIALAQRWKVRSVDALIQRLESYREREVQKAIAKGSEAKQQDVEDRCDTLLEVCRAVIAQNKQSIQDVVEFIDNLFADGAENVTVLATYHRAKGREWPRVFLWEHATRCPSKAARQEWQIQQERNLAYVAYTRAQSELVFVG